MKVKKRIATGGGRELALSLALLAGVVSGNADVVTNRLTGADGNGNGTLTTGSYWSLSHVPKEGEFALVDGFSFRMPASVSYVCNADAMQFGSIGSDKTCTWYVRSYGTTYDFPGTASGEGLILAKGVFQVWIDNDMKERQFLGNITVISPDDAPFRLSFNNNLTNTFYKITASMHAAAGCGLQIDRTAPSPGNGVSFLGDMSGYNGKISVKEACIAKFGTVSMPGRLAIGSGAVLSPNDHNTTVKIGTLDLSDGAIIDVPAAFKEPDSAVNATISILNGFVMAGTPVVRVTSSLFAGQVSEETAIPILSVPEAKASFTEEDFVLDVSGVNLASDMLSLKTSVVDGMRILWLKRELPFVAMLDNNNSNDPAGSDDEDPPHSWPSNGGGLITPNFWSDSRVPHAGALYMSRSKNLRTCYDSSHDIFGGEMLYLSGGGFIIQSKQVTITNVVVFGSTSWYSWHGNGDKTTNTFATGGTKTFHGKKLELKEDFKFRHTDHGTYVILDVPISGKGKFTADADDASNGKGLTCYTELAGDNSSYTGLVSVVPTIGSTHRTSPTFDNTIELVISDACNLGGAMDSFKYNALAIDKKGVLWARKSVTLDDATRGIFIMEQGGGFRVSEGETLAVNEQITLRGELTKLGPGILALGGRPAFYGASTYTPSEGYNRLAVQEGMLKPLSTTATDGIAFTFAADAALLLDVPADTTQGVGRYGLYDVAWNTPFTLPDGVLNVVLDEASLPAEATTLRIPVCTVLSTAAPALDGKIAVRKPWKNSVVTVDPVVLDEGTVTFVATVRPCGMTVIVR